MSLGVFSVKNTHELCKEVGMKVKGKDVTPKCMGPELRSTKTHGMSRLEIRIASLV